MTTQIMVLCPSGDSNGSIKDGETETLDESKDEVEKEKEKEKEVEEKIETKEEEVEGKEKGTEVKIEEELPQQSGFILTTQRTKTTKVGHIAQLSILVDNWSLAFV